MESVRPCAQRWEPKKWRHTLATMDYSEKESQVLKVKNSSENAGVKEKKFGDGKNTLRKNQKGKEGRKALKDVNRLPTHTAGPVKTIDRPGTPIIKAGSRFRSLLSTKLKLLNPCAKYTKVPLALSTTSSKPQKQPPAEHLYGCLSTKKRSLAASQDKAFDVYKFQGSDSDGSIRILNAEKSKISARTSAAREIHVNYLDMPILKKEKLEHEIVETFSPKVLEKLENFKSLESKLRIIEEKIYHEKNFNVQEFLKKTKNPHRYFVNCKRKCSFNSTSLDFLQNSFPNVAAKVVATTYELGKYDMSLAVVSLKGLKISDKIPREWHSVEAEDLSQLQEFEFLTDLYELPRKKH